MESESSKERQIAKSAPKFASFQRSKKPSVTSKGNIKLADDPVLIDEAKRPSSRNDELRAKQHKCSKEKLYSSSNRSQQLRRGEVRHKEESLDTLKANASREEDHSNVFIVDRTGDPKNLEYGSLYSHEIPSYFRFGAGKVIGLSGHSTIDRLASNNKFVILDNQYDRSRKREKAAFSKLNQVGTKILRVRLDQDQSRGIDVNTDFIPIYHSKEPTQQGEPSETTPRSYLNASDERSTKAIDQSIDRDLMYGSETSTSDNDVGRPHQLDELVLQRRAELSRIIDADPTNCDAWLDFIDHQDKILGLDLKSTQFGCTQAERQSVSEIKMSIYEKAIKSAANTKDKERLLLEMMAECSKFWDIERLSSKWHSLLEDNPASPILWTRYLDFRQSESSTFRFDKIRTIYLNCLAILRNARKGNVIDHDAIYKNQVYIILRLTILMRESGFSEYAVALWQSMFEFVFYKPVQFQQKDYLCGGPSESKALSAFEDFWESEVPRVGEDHAEGWAKYSLHGGKTIEPKTVTGGLLESSTQGFESWARLERRASLLSRNPARTIDDIEENDPYRVILFSDVQFVLIEPPNPAGRFLLIEALLVFCHLPPYALGLTDDHLRIWMQDPFLRNEILHYSHKPLSFWKPQSVAVESRSQQQDGFYYESDPGAPHNSSPFRFSMPAYYLSTHSLFAVTDLWFSAFDSWENGYFGDDGPVEIEWVRRTLKALVQLDFISCNFIEYFLAFELRQEPSTVQKTAKRLIKNRPFSIQLYNSYALLEYRSGNARSAENVIVTTINMSMTMSDTTRQESVLLWCTWIWELLSSGQPMLALERLLTFPSQNVTGDRTQDRSALSHNVGAFEPELITRTQEALISARDYLISYSLVRHAIAAAECLILLDYLSNQLSLSAAQSALAQNSQVFSTKFSSSPSWKESLHQAFAKLLHHHVTQKHPFAPSLVRSSLAESISLFPQNTMFLSLYAWIESRFRIDDRVRSIMNSIVLTNSHDRNHPNPESLSGHFFAIHAELNRSVTLGSNTHTIRSTFERAVASTCGAHCAGLWKLYILWEHSLGDSPPRAKNVFYRAISACPWAKELYMLAFWHLAPGLGGVALRGIYEAMEEKELRLHVAIEDVLPAGEEMGRST